MAFPLVLEITKTENILDSWEVKLGSPANINIPTSHLLICGKNGLADPIVFFAIFYDMSYRAPVKPLKDHMKLGGGCRLDNPEIRPWRRLAIVMGKDYEPLRLKKNL